MLILLSVYTHFDHRLLTSTYSLKISKIQLKSVVSQLVAAFVKRLDIIRDHVLTDITPRKSRMLPFELNLELKELPKLRHCSGRF
jgi:hypothetical protein